ncbi:MAG: MBL fold metallo-hydrolase [Candidatus Bathyarchaeia archaeon]
MVKEVFPNLFQIRVPLPNNPLKHLNTYLIKSSDKILLIDTGLNFPRVFEALNHGLSKAGVNPQKLTDVLITHFHMDHVGLIPLLREVSENFTIWIHKAEKELSQIIAKDRMQYLDTIKNFLKSFDAPLSLIANLQNFHPASITPKAYEEIAKAAWPLEGNEEISVGNYNFQILWTPGHSPGHVCLYEPRLKAFISGDHVLPTITPHVSQFMANMNPLKDYLESLRRVKELDVRIVLPAHEEVFTNFVERVNQLKEHHKQRLIEILTCIKNEKTTPYALASTIQWHVSYNSWDNFPLLQKYLALGETLAHLTFLEKNGLIKRNVFDQKIFYELSGTSFFELLENILG